LVVIDSAAAVVTAVAAVVVSCCCCCCCCCCCFAMLSSHDLGRQQGGGVLTDMLCHSTEAARFLLTEPGKPRESLTVVAISATGTAAVIYLFLPFK
jgi:hypothetical protein